MIQINLVPDVKQELIRAQRQRSMVISVAIIASIAAAALVVVLAAYVYGVQSVRGSLSDGNIEREAEKLAQFEDLSDTLTIQNQLSLISERHADKQVSSRLFSVIATIDPPSPDNMTISNFNLDSESSTVAIEGYALGGYRAVEVFKKTIEATTIEFRDGDSTQSVSLTENVNIRETSYGENSEGQKVLRFSIDFVHSPEVFAYGSGNLRVVAPTRENATDSYRRLPHGLFGEQAKDLEEGN